MAEIINLDKRDGYIYDPYIKAYDTTFWKSVIGTPTISSNTIQYNAAESSSYLLHIFAEVEFSVNIPAVPTSGDVRQFGLKSPSTNNLGGVYFDITGTVFSVKVYDNMGVLYTIPLTFTSGWAGNQTIFRLRWEPGQIIVSIGTTAANCAVVAAVGPNICGIPDGPMALTINNGNSDNMQVAYIAVRRAASII